MKVTTGVPRGQQQCPVAIFSRLLGAEVALSSLAGTCRQEAEMHGLEAAAALLACQHEELEGMVDAVAALAVAEMGCPEEGMREFVVGTERVGQYAGYRGLAEAHAAVAGVIETDMLPFLHSEKDRNVGIAMGLLCTRHRAMAAALGDIL